MTLVHESILTELKASGKLPTPAGVALTILELTRDPESSTDDITQVLKGDPSLSGQILKYANSASSGAHGEVVTVNDALVRLGMRQVQQLCLGFSVLSTSRTGLCPAFDYPRFWARSLARAVSAQILCAVIPGLNAEEGFTCGLLADVGSLGLASVYPHDYSAILEHWDHGKPSELSALEMERLSIDRHQVTAALFEDWGLPETFNRAAQNQDRVRIGPEVEVSDVDSLARLLHIAGQAADLCLAAGLEQGLRTLDYLELGAALGIDEMTWRGIFDEIRAEWERMGQVLGVATESVPSLEKLQRRVDEARRADRMEEVRSRRGRVEAEVGGGDGTLAAAIGLDILIATDNAVEQKILLTKLGAAGHHPRLAEDGRRALEIALDSGPQVILANWSLANIDGLELCRMMRSSEQVAGTYYIMMTSHDDRNALVEAFEAGIDDYLVKPLNYDVLTARLKAAARIIQLQQQSARDREELRQTVTELSILSRQLERTALEDQLTALPNRRAGLDRFDQEWSRSSRNESSLLCMLLDIDHFKKVNDTYGHDIGDEVLKETARALKGAIRDSDTVCRFGGEEFLIICPEADLATAMKIGDRIRRSVEKNRIQRPGYDGGVTVSVGVALRTGEQDSPKDLIKEADLALYAAKDNGRNKVCIYSD